MPFSTLSADSSRYAISGIVGGTINRAREDLSQYPVSLREGLEKVRAEAPHTRTCEDEYASYNLNDAGQAIDDIDSH